MVSLHTPVPTLGGGILGKLKSNVLNNFHWAGYYWQAQIQRLTKNRVYLRFWAQILNTQASSCITDSLSHTMCVETNDQNGLKLQFYFHCIGNSPHFYAIVCLLYLLYLGNLLTFIVKSSVTISTIKEKSSIRRHIRLRWELDISIHVDQFCRRYSGGYHGFISTSGAAE